MCYNGQKSERGTIMKVESTIKMLMAARGITQETMAKMCGLASSAGVRTRLRNGNMTFGTALEMLEILGYEVIIRESHSGRRREDEIIITMEDEV